MKPKASVQAVIFDKKTKHFLIINREDFYTKKYDWRLVKGGLEHGEHENVALKREIREEVGLDKFEISQKIYNYSFINPNGSKTPVSVFLVYSNENEKTKPSVEEKIREIKWVSAKSAILMLKFKDEKISIKKTVKLISIL